MIGPSAVRNGTKIFFSCPSSVPIVIVSGCKVCKNNGNHINWSQFATIGQKRSLCSVWSPGDCDFKEDSDTTSFKRKACVTAKDPTKTRQGFDEIINRINIEPWRQHITNDNGDAPSSRQTLLFRSKLNHEHHPSLCSTLHNSHFTVYYNNNTKTPCWVYEYLTPENLKRQTASRKNTKFREDFSLSHRSRATLQDYKRSGFDRGHMAAAGNYRKSQEAMNQTFLLSNILPQVGSGFNQSIWKHLEEGVRDIVLMSDCVHLYTGPLYIPRRDQNGTECVKYKVIGQNQVAVPTHLFKTMLIVRQSYHPLTEYHSLSVMMPNRNISDSSHIEDFLVSIADVESASGLQFFVSLGENKVKYHEVIGGQSDENGFIDIFRAKRQFL